MARSFMQTDRTVMEKQIMNLKNVVDKERQNNTFPANIIIHKVMDRWRDGSRFTNNSARNSQALTKC